MGLVIAISPGYGEMYKWVDEKGTIHFADDLSNVPEKYRPDAERRKTPVEITSSGVAERPESPPVSSPKPAEPEKIEVDLSRKGEIWFTEVILNGRLKQNFVVDTGASFTLINRVAAKELGIPVNETTPFIRVSSVTDVVLTPLITLDSIKVGRAEVENVEALIYPLASGGDGLLGNSFLNKFRVVIDSMSGKMTLYTMKGISSLDRPGGYNKDYWVGQFRFYHRNLEDLKGFKAKIEAQGTRLDLNRVNNAIRYFENKLNDLERRASLAGVPRNWRE
jgi:clan AA aspartic protease (TIGR02281 family)